MSPSVRAKFSIVLFVILLILLFFKFGGDQYFSLSYIKANRDQAIAFYQDNRVLTILLYMLTYVGMTAISLPGATVLTLLGGAVFGLIPGVIIISFASTIGATLVFLVARYLLRDMVQRRFEKRLRSVNASFQNEGAFYLFSMRLIPAIPFFVINILMALTPIKTWTFYWVSQLGMLVGTVVYVNAGTEMAKIESVDNLLSIRLIVAFVLLGITPLALKKLLGHIRSKRFRTPEDSSLVDS